MKNKTQFTETLIAGIRRAQQGQLFFEEVYTDPALAAGKNEFLFFIKPEVTLPSESIRLEGVLGLVYEQVSAYGLGIHNTIILSAGYLERYNIIAQHYGVINRIASNAREHMPEAAKEAFQEIYGHTIYDVKVLGGIEFLEAYTEFNAKTIAYLWQNCEFKKLAGGTYCVKVVLGDDTIYLINGFHPNQLIHFTEAGRSIVAMTLSGDLRWDEARNDFIGSTDPSRAKAGSLRKVFYDRQGELGLPNIAPSTNGVHLSAGPVEGLVELRRYNSDFSHTARTRSWADFSFGKKLQAVFPEDVVKKITGNVDLTLDGKTVSVFDLTEEKDSDEALALLMQHFETAES